jgi:DNA polymerase III epsilon subunit-like protein
MSYYKRSLCVHSQYRGLIDVLLASHAMMVTLFAFAFSRGGVNMARARCSAQRLCSTMAAPPLIRDMEHAAGLAYDLETTGLDTSKNEIVQFAVVVANSQRGLKFSRLVLPEGPIDEGAAAVHGFTRSVLIDRGAKPFADVWAECEEWLLRELGSSRPLVWAAHNGASFDQPILCRCVRKVEEQRTHTHAGVSSSPLRAPRAAWVDTLQLARAALPKRRPPVVGLGPYTLGSLYYSASGGESLEGAHDALADADALAKVWRWLIEEAGADSTSTRWAPPPPAAVEQPSFQAHLQFHGYHMRPPPRRLSGDMPRATTGKGANSHGGAAASTKGSANAVAAPSAPASSLDSLTRIAGIGPYVAQRLFGKGIESYDDLERLWREGCGGQRTRMIGYLRKSMPGASPLVLAKAVKGMQSEWGGGGRGSAERP